MTFDGQRSAAEPAPGPRPRPTGRHPQIVLTHGRLGEFVGTTRESVSGMPSSFAENGVIRFSRGQVAVLAPGLPAWSGDEAG